MPTPRDGWTAILPELDSSGLTAVRFGARRRLSLLTFRPCRKRLAHRAPLAFVEALPPASASGVFSALTVELR